MKYPDTILVVDDNELNRRMLCAKLKKILSNAIIVEAGGGEMALDLVAKQIKETGANFNMIVMDYQMPKMNGQEATTLIRQYEEKTELMLAEKACIVQWTTEPQYKNKLYIGANLAMEKDPITPSAVQQTVQAYWEYSKQFDKNQSEDNDSNSLSQASLSSSILPFPKK